MYRCHLIEQCFTLESKVVWFKFPRLSLLLELMEYCSSIHYFGCYSYFGRIHHWLSMMLSRYWKTSSFPLLSWAADPDFCLLSCSLNFVFYLWRIRRMRSQSWGGPRGKAKNWRLGIGCRTNNDTAMNLSYRNLLLTCLRMWLDQGQQVLQDKTAARSEEHTSELQSRQYLVCRLLLEKKKKHTIKKKTKTQYMENTTIESHASTAYKAHKITPPHVA